MPYHVTEVTDRKTFRDFINLPYHIYRDDAYWVTPITAEVLRQLNSKKNPYFKDNSLKLFNCYENDRICARTILTINRNYIKKFNAHCASFGYYESLNDFQATAVLFDAVETCCRQSGVDFLDGPFNPNYYSELGIKVTHFGNTPSYFQTYNPPYYSELLTRAGFTQTKRIFTLSNHNISEYIRKNYPQEIKNTPDGFRTRPFRYDHKTRDLNFLREIMNDAFSQNWHFLPLSEEEYKYAAKYLSLVTPSNFIQFVEFDGRPVGAVHLVLDINPIIKLFHGKAGIIEYLRLKTGRNKISKIIVFAVGIKKSFQKTPALRQLCNTTAQIVKDFQVMETTWTSDDNLAALKTAEKFGLKRDCEFVIMEKRF